MRIIAVYKNLYFFQLVKSLFLIFEILLLSDFFYRSYPHSHNAPISHNDAKHDICQHHSYVHLLFHIMIVHTKTN